MRASRSSGAEGDPGARQVSSSGGFEALGVGDASRFGDARSAGQKRSCERRVHADDGVSRRSQRRKGRQLGPLLVGEAPVES